ncbi:CDC27 family protein [Xenorhabdus bovienii]|uniref:tetratricopeptide repeat protein n=1 Tax=Xenorhabdus bovienii TaxID=40576 RepID=UPI0023B35851|nr:CDC27 family protein [Xenorhabdus bovienii]MDE9447080.1 CDC27 family protein [Xenorhabdus bovienii]
MYSESQSLVEATLYYNRTGVKESIWSRATCSALTNHNFDMNGYVITQAMEFSLLKEVARVANIPYVDVVNFNYVCTGPSSALQWLLSMRINLPDIQKVNLARALITTARYHLAQDILSTVNSNKLQPEQKVTYLITLFIVRNRLEPQINCTDLFERIKQIIEEKKISEENILEAASQAIVWHLKTGTIDLLTYEWFQACGKSIAEKIIECKTFKAKLALSSFYRAYAMVPAAINDASETRLLMLKSQHFADILEPENELEAALAETAKKTVLESSIKEMMYVSQKWDIAEEYAMALVTLDPYWSVNYQELAEVYLKQNKYTKALEQYQNAKQAGLPRVTFTEYMIGVCHEHLGDHQEAINSFKNVLTMDETNISAGLSGYNISSKYDLESKEYFREFINRWDEQGFLTPMHKEMIV